LLNTLMYFSYVKIKVLRKTKFTRIFKYLLCVSETPKFVLLTSAD